MGWYLYILAFVTACTLSHAARQNNEACSTDPPYGKLASLLTEIRGVSNVIERATQEDMQKKLTDIRQNQDDMRQEQQDLKEHTLNRLDALDEKMEWFLSKGQQGAHPMSDRMSQIEGKLEQQNVTLNILHPMSDRMSQVEQHLQQQNTTLALIKDFLFINKDCQDVYDRGSRTSGDYIISPDGITKITVYCEQELDGGGWTVFQRRQDGSVDFYRDWAEYKTGFGAVNGEFWLGNDNIHLLTKRHNQKLKIELTYNGQVKFADYSTFWIENEAQKYKLTVSGFSGSSPPGDSLTYHNQSAFSTKDSDNDVYSGQCAQMYTGAWWYGPGCGYSNLNGVYGSTEHAKGVNWYHWKGVRVSMTGTRMMVKRKN